MQPDAVKGKYPFNADNYLGWRGVDDIHSVTGEPSGVAAWAQRGRVQCMPPGSESASPGNPAAAPPLPRLHSSPPHTNPHPPAGTKLWEWFSVGRWGLESYNCKEQRFDGEKWVDELGASGGMAGRWGGGGGPLLLTSMCGGCCPPHPFAPLGSSLLSCAMLLLQHQLLPATPPPVPRLRNRRGLPRRGAGLAGARSRPCHQDSVCPVDRAGTR